MIIRRIVSAIDSINDWTGQLFCWASVALVLIGTYDSIMRYVFRLPTIWAYQTSTMLGGAIIVFGWGYVLLKKRHVRVDIFYTRLSDRRKAILDFVCSLFLFFPLITLLIIVSFRWMWQAWLNHEIMPETYWWPPAGPFKTAIVVGLCLFLLQGIAETIRNFYRIINKPFEEEGR
jgi:TRAP-type mannitol/chloroaromatic compound transport system permease small subunit